MQWNDNKCKNKRLGLCKRIGESRRASPPSQSRSGGDLGQLGSLASLTSHPPIFPPIARPQPFCYPVMGFLRNDVRRQTCLRLRKGALPPTERAQSIKLGLLLTTMHGVGLSSADALQYNQAHPRRRCRQLLDRPWRRPCRYSPGSGGLVGIWAVKTPKPATTDTSISLSTRR